MNSGERKANMSGHRHQPNNMQNLLSEEHRLEALHQTGLLDSDDEDILSEHTKLLSRIFECPIVAVSLVDRDRLYLASRTGLDLRELQKKDSFCASVVESQTPLTVIDAERDERFCDTSLVTEAGIRFYAGYPITIFPGCCIGSLCVLNSTPTQPSEVMMEALRVHGLQVAHIIGLRRELFMKDKFYTEAIVASGTIHGIKNALTPAVAFLDLYESDSNGLDNKKILEICSQSLRTAAQKLSQLDYGNRWRATEDQGRITADLIIGELADQLIVIAVAESIKIEVDIGAGTDSFVLTDPAMFRETVTNLMLNAIDALRGDGGLLRVQTRLENEALVVKVVDNGSGMSPEVSSRCFDPLFSTKHNDKSAFGGSGVGLSIVKHHISELGGQITVESEELKETVFRIVLPPVDNVQVDDEQAQERTNASFLCVDDEPLVLKALEAAVQSQGHKTVACTEWQTALAVFTERPYDFDAAIIDLGLNSGNGIDLARQLRHSRPDLPVAIVSGNSIPQLHAESWMEYLSKPYTLKQLCALLQKLLSDACNASNAQSDSGSRP